MVEGYELDQLWWQTSVQDLRDEMKALHSFVQEEGMPLPEDVEKVRDQYAPSSVGKLVNERLEHAFNTIE